MKHGSHSKRSRGRARRPNNANRHYDSNGPDVRIRGTAAQIFDKYQALARDASSSGDRVAAESYLQHAEHYYRIMMANNAANGRANMHPDEPQLEEGDDSAGTDTPAEAANNGDAADEAAEAPAAEAVVESTKPKPVPQPDAAEDTETEAA